MEHLNFFELGIPGVPGNTSILRNLNWNTSIQIPNDGPDYYLYTASKKETSLKLIQQVLVIGNLKTVIVIYPEPYSFIAFYWFCIYDL